MLKKIRSLLFSKKPLLFFLSLRGMTLTANFILLQNSSLLGIDGQTLAIALLVLGNDYGNFLFYTSPPSKQDEKWSLKRGWLSIFAFLLLAITIGIHLPKPLTITSLSMIIGASFYSILLGALTPILTRKNEIRPFLVLSVILMCATIFAANHQMILATFLFFLSPLPLIVFVREDLQKSIRQLLSLKKIQLCVATAILGGLSSILLAASAVNSPIEIRMQSTLILRILLIGTTALSIVQLSFCLSDGKITNKKLFFVGFPAAFLVFFGGGIISVITFFSQSNVYDYLFILGSVAICTLMLVRSALVLQLVSETDTGLRSTGFFALAIVGQTFVLAAPTLNVTSRIYLGAAAVYELITIILSTRMLKKIDTTVVT